MPPSRLLRPAVLVSLLSTAHAASPAPLTGEWLIGTQYAAQVYESDVGRAASSTERLLLRPDGTYVLSTLTLSHVPGWFGAYLISCESLDSLLERGTFKVNGSVIAFQPSEINRRRGQSPNTLNAGCKRLAGVGGTAKLDAYQGKWQRNGAQLVLTFGNGRFTYSRRTTQPSPPPAPPTPAAAAPATPVKPAPGPVPSTPWTAQGRWKATLTTAAGARTVVFNTVEDRGLSGSGFENENVVAWLDGDSATGTLRIGLEVGDDEVILTVQGHFQGDTYSGTVKVSGEDGKDLGTGTLTMERQPRPR